MKTRVRVLLGGVLVLALAGSMSGVAQAGAVTIKATKNDTWNPKVVSVEKGTKVIWKNAGIIKHDLTSDSSNWSKATNLSVGDQTSYRFSRKGTYVFVCTLHTGMRGKVIVG